MRGSIVVHAAHCCKWHGCKYGEDDCPVANGEVEQEYICEGCWRDLKDEEWTRKKLVRIEEIKRWQEAKKN
jgi:hypothetical protein